MSEKIIDVSHVTMNFNLPKERLENIKEYFIKLMQRKLYFEKFTALDDVSFSINKGDVFGIVGLNGAGKSTVLKLISGIMTPSEGHIAVNGTIAPLIELGAGFDMELTARENIFLNASVLGYSPSFIRSKYDEIIEFAELENFQDVAVKNFSSGMVARLGFSIATMVTPDILIVDEILSVGDYLFQQKCEKRIAEIMDSSATVILVSHSLDQIRKLCNRVLWLDHGKVKMCGDMAQVCDCYEQFRP